MQPPLPQVLIYQLRVTLLGTEPLIWRTIQVRSDVRLPKLHRILQAAMGWRNEHLHEFLLTPRQERALLEDLGRLPRSEGSVRVDDVLRGRRSKLIYVYDMGDGWQHELCLEDMLVPTSDTHYPRCLAGARACPPEDCGGLGGYALLLKALQNPRHPRHASTLEWLRETTGDFQPETFDLDATNRKLGRFK